MADKVDKDEESIAKVCGIVMPISGIDSYDENHWAEVREIITDSIEKAGFEANLVSDADDVGIIQKRIIQNLYDNPVVVCDVSGKNPNVMFELGIRLAFDKPTIIVKDDKTSYSFDTAPIEHLEYPKDLRFSKIIEFKKILIEKIKKTYEKSVSDPDYTTFLKHFGEFTIAKIDQKEISGQEYILKELESMRALLYRIDRNSVQKTSERSSPSPSLFSDFEPIEKVKKVDFCLPEYGFHNNSEKEIQAAVDEINLLNGVKEFYFKKEDNHKHLVVILEEFANKNVLRRRIDKVLKNIILKLKE